MVLRFGRRVVCPKIACQSRQTSKRRAAICRRRLGAELLEARLMLDATADFYASVGAAQSLYASQTTTEDAAFQTTEQNDFGSFATEAEGIGEGLQTDVASDEQTLQTASDSAEQKMQSDDATSDQTDATLNQSADDLAQQKIVQAQQDDQSTVASDDAQLQSTFGTEQDTANGTLNGNIDGFNGTISADESQTSSNISADEDAFNSTSAGNDAAAQQTDASLESGNDAQVDSLSTSTIDQLGGAAPSVDPGVVDSDPGFQAALSQGNEAWNAATQQAQNDITNGDAAAAPLYQAASDQLATDLQKAQDNYNTNAQNAQGQYNLAVAPFQPQLTNTLASDQDTYNTNVQSATDTYNSDMQNAANNEAASDAKADAAYNTSAQPLIDGYNTWLTGRSSQYQTDMTNREAQLATDLAGEDQTYNDTINGTAAVAGLAPAEQSAIATANSTYDGQIAGLQSTQTSEDAGVWSTYDNTVSGADQTLSAAQGTYNDAVNKIDSDAMNSGQPPDQSALNAAYNTLLTADHAHANSVASAEQALTTGLGADENEFVKNQKPYYVQKEDAIAGAEGDFETGEAAAAKLRDDNDADHYASRDADEASITSGYDDDVATHEEGLQYALDGFQATRAAAYADAQKQYIIDEATAWQKEQKAIADALQQQSNDDAAAYENYNSQIIGPWQTLENQLAAAAQQWANDAATAYAACSTSMAAAQAQQMSGYESAYDTGMGDIEAGLNTYASIVAPAWAAAIIAASGNDPDTTTWANAWASFDQQAMADDASLMAQQTAQQDNEVTQDNAAYLKLVGQMNSESQNLAQEWGNALVGLMSADAGVIAGYVGQALPQMLATIQADINAGRTEAGKQIDADTQDMQSHAANDDQDAKDHDAHWLTFAQTLLPVELSTFTAVNDEAATDVGTLESDAAGFVKQMDGAAVTEIGNLVPDAKAMIHTEAGATADYDIAITAQQVGDANAAAAANVTAVLNAPDSQFAGESFGGGMPFGAFTPPDPDGVMPDKDLPQPESGWLTSFLSGVADFAQALNDVVTSVIISGMSPAAAGAQLADAALNALPGGPGGNPILAAGDFLTGAFTGATSIVASAMGWGGPPNWFDSLLAVGSNISVGFANTITFGYASTWIGDNMQYVNQDSWWYTLGQAGGYVWFGTMGTALVWSAAGLPTYGIGVQAGGPYGFHTIFSVASGGAPTWAGAVGPELGAMGVYGAPSAVVGSSMTLTGIPAIFPAYVLPATLDGAAAWSCITAAGAGFVNGLLGPGSPFKW